MSKIVFHIGHRKTGTSSIQRALAEGRIALRDKSILYPCKVNHNYLHNHMSSYLKDGTVLSGSPGRPGLETLQKMIREGASDYTVLSGEQFEGSDPGDVQKILEEFFLPHVQNHSVICYLRPHASRVLSSFAESTKVGVPTKTPETFHRTTLKRGRFLYAPQMQGWVSQFQDRFQMRAMVRDRLVGKSVVNDFVQQAFGADADGARISEQETINPSLCIEDLMLLRVLQNHVRHRGKPLGVMMGWEVARLIALENTPRTRTKPTLHKKLAKEIRRDYLEDAREMDRRYFPNDPVFVRELDRAVDEAPRTAQSYRPRDYFSPEMLANIRVMARLIDEMLDNDGGDWPGFLREVRYDAALSKS